MSDKFLLLSILFFLAFMFLVMVIAHTHGDSEINKLKIACAVYEAELRILKEARR